MSDLVDRRYVSRFSQPGFGLRVYRAGNVSDADANPTVSLLLGEATVPEWTRATEKVETGSYAVTLSSLDTQDQGLASLRWDYQIEGTPQIYVEDLEVGPTAPAYDALPPAWQSIIEGVWVKFADLFDSPYGGPNLQVYVQTKFGRNRIAQLVGDALQPLNTASSPHKTYPLGGIDFPFDAWGGLLGDSLYIEVVKHLIRSYTEIPEAVLGTVVSRMDRRDYFDRWQTVLSLEEEDFRVNLSRYRMAHLGLGNFSVLVAGGAYGNWGPQINPGGVGAAAARGYYWTSRWH